MPATRATALVKMVGRHLGVFSFSCFLRALSYLYALGGVHVAVVGTPSSEGHCPEHEFSIRQAGEMTGITVFVIGRAASSAD